MILLAKTHFGQNISAKVAVSEMCKRFGEISSDFNSFQNELEVTP